MAKKREWFNFNTAIAILLVLSLFVIFRTAFTSETKTDLVQEAEVVLYTLTTGDTKVTLISSNELVEEKIRNLNRMDYDEIKNLLGIRSDFCIFFEDITGNLVTIENINSGIGSNKIYINGKPCK